MVDDPLEGGAVAEAVVVDVEGDAAEGEEVVVSKLGLVESFMRVTRKVTSAVWL